jgi:predicted metal-dependent phosphotriesterase family hydrolase
VAAIRPTTLEEIGLRAAARAAKATEAPIRIHTDAANRAGDSHAVVLEDEGVNPARVSFDHSDDGGDMDYFLGLMSRGYSLGMDHVHRGISPDFKPSFAICSSTARTLVSSRLCLLPPGTWRVRSPGSDAPECTV